MIQNKSVLYSGFRFDEKMSIVVEHFENQAGDGPVQYIGRPLQMMPFETQNCKWRLFPEQRLPMAMAGAMHFSRIICEDNEQSSDTACRRVEAVVRHRECRIPRENEFFTDHII